MSGYPPEIIGKSSKLLAALARAKIVAKNSRSVCIYGETGTGKDLVARYIHHYSPRSSKPFVHENCASTPEQLFESKYFGHEKGAFSGAIKKQDGLFVQADGGTLYLDEIGDMPRQFQTKLLVALQRQEFRPVGGNATIKVNVRIIAATNRDMDALVKQGNFREDMLHRLQVHSIWLPPLRDRGNDVVLLARHFLLMEPDLEKKQLGRDSLDLLRQFPWYGNARQLHHVLSEAATGSHRRINARHIQPYLNGFDVADNKVNNDQETQEYRDRLKTPERILEFLNTFGPASIPEIRKALNLSNSTTSRHIVTLKANGRILSIGSGRKIRYLPRISQ